MEAGRHLLARVGPLIEDLQLTLSVRPPADELAARMAALELEQKFGGLQLRAWEPATLLRPLEPARLRSLRLDLSGPLPEAALAATARFPRLTCLELGSQGTTAPPAALTALTALTALRHLAIVYRGEQGHTLAPPLPPAWPALTSFLFRSFREVYDWEEGEVQVRGDGGRSTGRPLPAACELCKVSLHAQVLGINTYTPASRPIRSWLA